MKTDRFLEIDNWKFWILFSVRKLKCAIGITVFLLLLPIFLQAQEYQLHQEIETTARYFATDKLQNIYLVLPQNEVVKYNKAGQEIFRYNNNRLGELTHIDANNPFKIGLFYGEFGNLISLDRTMTPTGELRLFDFNLIQVDAVALAADNNIWLYDKLDFQLKKINQNGEILFESGDLSLTINQSLQPNFLIEREQQIYLNDPNIGILVFDVFGQFEKTLEFKGLREFQILDGQLLFFQNGELTAFNLQSLLSQSIKLPDGIGAKALVMVQKNRLYILENGYLKVYEF